MFKLFKNLKFNHFKNQTRSLLTKLSQAFMLPIAILPFAGLMLGIGGAISANVTNDTAITIANFFKGMSEVIFANLALFFGASVVIAFSNKNRIYATFMFLIAYLVFLTIQQVFIFMNNGEFESILYFHTNQNNRFIVGQQLGIRSLQTSIFGGIIVGAIVAYVMNRGSEIELPTYLGFFSGIRLVPMIIIPLSSLLALLFLIFWPWIGILISVIGNATAKTPGGVDGLIYGILGRALMPFGLHHIVIAIAWQTNLGGQLSANDFSTAAQQLGVLQHEDVQTVIKSFLNNDGTNRIITGDQNIWIFINALPVNRLPINNSGSTMPIFEWVAKYADIYAGRFTQDYPTYLGTIQGIGLALILTAKKENRKRTIAIIGSAMIVAFLTGITEPLEFSFLFIAPLFYYAIYVPLSGFAYMFMKLSGAHVGVGFARGFIDYIIYGVVPYAKGTNFYWALPIAAGLGTISFTSFYFMIKKFNYQTPGRASDVQLINKKQYQELKQTGKNVEMVDQLVEAYGGVENLKNVTACATRLRVTVNDETKVDKDKIIELGALGFIAKGTSSQAIFGGKAQILSSQINEKYADKIKKSN